MLGCDFHRQKPIDEYIVDFCCPSLDLVIEIDGNSHDDEKAMRKDSVRQKRLEELGLVFLRFSDIDVKINMTQVLRTIEITVSEMLNK
jgi:very-short-patch-repair endonuclease